MGKIFRYPNTQVISTSLNPVDDMISWYQRLRSISYTSELLRSVHGMSKKKDISIATKAIKVHVDIATALLEQAFASTPQTCYLPLYYAMASLAKIVIIAKGFQEKLDSQRSHGATWSGNMHNPRNFLNDYISLRGQGVIPLYYSVITGQSLPLNSKGKRRVFIKDLCGYIPSIGYEYVDLTNSAFLFDKANVYLHQNGNKSYVSIGIDTEIQERHVEFKRHNYQLLKGLKATEKGKFITKLGFERDVLKQVPTYMLYDYELGRYSRSPVTLTPRSSSKLLLFEELPIYLIFFHLSNVVRYNPERLYQFFDGEEVGFLHALSHYGVYSLLTSFWSALHNVSYQFQRD